MSLIEMLKEAGIVKIKTLDEEPFTLKSGKKSRLFIDIKEASLNPRILEKITQNVIRIITEEIPDISLTNANFHDMHIFLFDKIASVAIGGIPVATALSLEINVSQIIVRSEKHDRGTESQIIGNCLNMKCILIEDVATSGDSITKAVRAIREAGGICNTCIVVVDRQEGADKNCLDNGINLMSLLKKSDFGIKEIPDEEIEKILEIRKQQKKEIEENENALTEVNTAFETIQEQLNELKKNVTILNQKIQENQGKLDRTEFYANLE